jgi:hypothetical protein
VQCQQRKKNRREKVAAKKKKEERCKDGKEKKIGELQCLQIFFKGYIIKEQDLTLTVLV